jgi:hypothetical protein
LHSQQTFTRDLLYNLYFNTTYIYIYIYIYTTQKSKFRRCTNSVVRTQNILT